MMNCAADENPICEYNRSIGGRPEMLSGFTTNSNSGRNAATVKKSRSAFKMTSNMIQADCLLAAGDKSERTTLSVVLLNFS